MREILQATVTFGCRVAGVKIGQRGFDDLGEINKKIFLKLVNSLYISVC